MMNRVYGYFPSNSLLRVIGTSVSSQSGSVNHWTSSLTWLELSELVSPSAS